MTFDEWLAYGVENQFCTEQFCNTHDGYPLVKAERDRYKTALLAIAHQEWQGATACRCIAHEALDGEA